MSIIIRVHHIRAAKLCGNGVRAWFRHQGVDYNDFLQNGMPIEQVEAMNDGFAEQVCAAAREEAAKLEAGDGR